MLRKDEDQKEEDDEGNVKKQEGDGLKKHLPIAMKHFASMWFVG